MSIRTRLVLLLSTLLVLLGVAQMIWVRSLTRNLAEELGKATASVTTKVFEVLRVEASGTNESGGVGSATKSASRPERRILRQQIETIEGSEGERILALGLQPLDPGNKRFVWNFPDDTHPPATVEVKRLAGSTFVANDSLSDVVAEHGGSSDRSIVTEHENVALHFASWPDSRIHIAFDAEPGELVVRSSEGLEQRLRVPTRGIEGTMAKFSRQLLVGQITLFGLALIAVTLLAYRSMAPLRRLAEAAQRVGTGELGVKVQRARGTSGGGEVAFAIEAFDQMSDRLVALDRQTRAYEARQHLSELGEVGRGFAHTLRNPLNALGLSVEQLAALVPESEEEGSAADALATSARRQIRRIDESLRSFLALGEQEVTPTRPVDIEAMIRSLALECHQDTPAERRVHIEVEIESRLEPLLGIETELAAALQALVVNAIEASPTGATVHIRVEPIRSTSEDSPAEASQTGDAPQLRCRVEDRGPGLSPAVRERLFAPHVTTKASGSGMGLFLARRIAVDRYGGTLTMIDREGGGTCAELTLGPRVGSTTEGHHEEEC